MRWAQALRYASLPPRCVYPSLLAPNSPRRPPGVLKNLSLLKPPGNSKVAIVDRTSVVLTGRCPSIELQAAADTHVPIERYDLLSPATYGPMREPCALDYIQDRDQSSARKPVPN